MLDVQLCHISRRVILPGSCALSPASLEMLQSDLEEESTFGIAVKRAPIG